MWRVINPRVKLAAELLFAVLTILALASIR
jgi:hypothetical protein